MSALPPALVVVPVKGRTASAMYREQIVDRTCFQTSQRHQRLECRSRCKLSLNRPVQQRMIRVVDELFPVGRFDTHGELVGVEGGPAGHGKDLAISRIERHDSAFAPLKSQLR